MGAAAAPAALLALALVCRRGAAAARGTPTPTHLFVTRVGPCDGEGSGALPVAVSEMRIARKLYDFSISGDLNISVDIDDGWQLKATMQKCQDLRNLDTCDNFRSFAVIERGCDSAEPADLDTYNMFFYYTHPRLTCPLRAGAYKIVSFPFFMEDNYLFVSESKISTSIFGYTFKLELSAKEARMACVEALLQLLYIRDHAWQDAPTPPRRIPLQGDRDHSSPSTLY